MSAHDHSHSHKSHEASLKEELICHFPYAAFSLALGFVILGFMHVLSLAISNKEALSDGYFILFHTLHYLHLTFATMGTLITFLRFSKRIVPALIVSLISPAIFCTLSDVALPTFAANLVGADVQMHICFTHAHDFFNLVPFMLVGLACGFAMRRHDEVSLGFVSLGSHFVHILISALAAVFYLISSGFETWYTDMGVLFFLLSCAVVVPCTLSDIVVPISFMRMGRARRRSA